MDGREQLFGLGTREIVELARQDIVDGRSFLLGELVEHVDLVARQPGA